MASPARRPSRRQCSSNSIDKTPDVSPTRSIPYGISTYGLESLSEITEEKSKPVKTISSVVDDLGVKIKKVRTVIDPDTDDDDVLIEGLEGYNIQRGYDSPLLRDLEQVLLRDKDDRERKIKTYTFSA